MQSTFKTLLTKFVKSYIRFYFYDYNCVDDLTIITCFLLDYGELLTGLSVHIFIVHKML